MSSANLERLHSRIDRDVQEIENSRLDDTQLLVNYGKLLRFSSDVDRIRQQTFQSAGLARFNDRLHSTDRTIQNLIVEVEVRINGMYTQKALQEKEEDEALRRAKTGTGLGGAPEIEVVEASGASSGYQNESIESLKSRLLSTKHDQLDQVQSAEVQNNYHDSIQQELIDSLPSMVSSIRDQALQFQELIKQDAVILKEATQNFESSHGKFDNVNSLLSQYHKEGRLGIWFYIRVIGMVLVSFLVLLIIIRLIPARH